MFKIKKLKEDEETYFAHKYVKINRKSFETSVKAIDLKYYTPNVPIAYDTFVEEVYKTIDKTLLNGFMENGENKERFNNNLKNILNNRVNPSNPLIFIPALKTLDISTEQIKYLLLTQRYFDFYTVPTLMKSKSIFENYGNSAIEKYYLPMINECLKLVEERSIEKHTIGSIPMTLPIKYIESLLNVYLEFGIGAVLVDLQGRTPFTVFQELTSI
ncbi:hypothetical protein [Methanocaldococcus fervens]|uniref:Uncharacterized protein n=1 Tax=Methanocaldococcus fervens (strain DSM 4213 / JCM 15782 / AG86) TaxID=573064 RepID=C7P8U2_METFA|nr:hypothetical protein [Methanocaldococcus fervens]ACV24974.1 hypothetical protein Mefer_1165 [Methanocaldococcus fervens AG86]